MRRCGMPHVRYFDPYGAWLVSRSIERIFLFSGIYGILT